MVWFFSSCSSNPTTNSETTNPSFYDKFKSGFVKNKLIAYHIHENSGFVDMELVVESGEQDIYISFSSSNNQFYESRISISPI